MEAEIEESVEELIDNEWYIVRHSGETPEIAYNSSIYFLERAADGPGVVLTKTQQDILKKAAIERYEEIILRDMYHDNVCKSIYRGIVRSICNYERFLNYCRRQDLDPCSVQKNAADLYSRFLQQEFLNISTGHTSTIINCTYIELEEFASALGVQFLPEYILFKQYCL
ncbi:hypothetical protein [Desulforhopalus sp. 52FAK]